MNQYYAVSHSAVKTIYYICEVSNTAHLSGIYK